MKDKKWIFGIFVIALIMIFLNFSNSKNVNSFESDREKDLQEEDVKSSKIDELMSNMTIEEKIGQMLVVSYDNDSFDDDFKNFFDEVKPGGIILTKDNITTFDNTLNLVKDLKNASFHPLIVSIDQEGGRVQRLKYLTDVTSTDVVDMLSLGETNDESLAYEVGKVLAEELRTIGVNVVYAPVLDIFSNPDNTVIGNRSFGSNADTVTKMALSLSKGLEDNGIIATFKHFPGHGDTSVDSHVGLPVINKSLKEAENLEFIPFKAAIEAGAKMIMTAHIAFPQITGDTTPASLSKIMLTKILKEKLGYKGLIITDAIDMKALTNNYSYEEIIVNSIEAGNDLILIPKDEIYTINYIKENISEERINESVKKILEFKYKYLNSYEYLDSSYLGSEEHQKVIDKILER